MIEAKSTAAAQRIKNEVTETSIEVTKTSTGVTETKIGVTGINIRAVAMTRSLHHLPRIRTGIKNTRVPETKSTNLRTGSATRIVIEVIKTNIAATRTDTPVLKTNTGDFTFILPNNLTLNMLTAQCQNKILKFYSFIF